MGIQELERNGLSIYDVRDQLKRHVYKRSTEAFDEGDRARDALLSTDDLMARQSYMRARFIENIGGLPSMETPLDAKVTGTVIGQGFTIEKIIFESRRNTYVTSNLYLPDGIDSPRGAVLFLCGHHETAKHNEEYQSVCQLLVHAGLVVLAMDPIGQGERLSYYEPSLQGATVRSCTGEHDYAGSQCWPLGDGLARYFVHDGMRAIDYLCSRPEVDPAKIGVTGNSGGGTQCSLMMICDPRIAAAAPATFITNRQTYQLAGGAQDAEQIWPGMTALGFDHEDILLAMAPKPVLVLAVTYDFFPIEGTRRTVERAKRLWEMCGASDKIGLVEDEWVHNYTPALAQAAAAFFSKYLLGEAVTPSRELIQPITPSLIWCTQTGQVRRDLADARAVYHENVDRVAKMEAQRADLSEEQRKQRALLWLKEAVFHSRKPCELNPRLYMKRDQIDELQIYNGMWWAQEGILNHGLLFRDFRYAGTDLPLTIAIWDKGTHCLQPHLQWIRETCVSGRAVMVLDVSGVGALTPHSLNNRDPGEFYEIIHKLANDLIWLNDSMAALRTYDVLRAIDMAEKLPHTKQNDIQLYAHGRQGFYGRLASVLDSRIKNIQAVNGMNSFSELVRARHYDDYDIMSVVLPGMLKYLDVPDLEQWYTQINK